jgi:hypothetical protein
VSFIASRSSFRTTVRGSSIARLGTKQAKGLGAQFLTYRKYSRVLSQF